MYQSITMLLWFTTLSMPFILPWVITLSVVMLMIYPDTVTKLSIAITSTRSRR